MSRGRLLFVGCGPGAAGRCRRICCAGGCPRRHLRGAIEVSRRAETLVGCTLEDLAETVEDTARGVLSIVLGRCADIRPRHPGEKVVAIALDVRDTLV